MSADRSRLPANALALGIFALTCASSAGAGAFLGFGQNNPNFVVHPSGYNGAAGELNVTVCLDQTALPASGNPVQAIRNAVARFNRFEGSTGNVISNPSGPESDFESVLMHELGHCLGLDHTALGPSETCDATANPFDSPHIYFANSFPATSGGASTCGPPIGNFTTDAGVDGVRGTRDDGRGSDVNRIWFHRLTNNPFQTPATVDRTTYSVGLAHLPGGHSFAEIATSFDPCNEGQPNSSALRGQPATQDVMFPVFCSNRLLRELAPNDVNAFRIARAGFNGVQGTGGDDYTVRLVYTEAQDCMIKVQFNPGAGYAFCQVGGNFVNGGSDLRISTGTTQFERGIEWVFNQTDTTGGVPNIGPTIGAGSPAPGTLTPLGGGAVGAFVSSSISFTASNGSGTGTTSLVCTVGSGTVAITSNATQSVPVGGTVQPVGVRFTLTSVAQSGVVSCTATPQGGSPAAFTYTFSVPAGDAAGGPVCSHPCVHRSGFEAGEGG
jgi:hypothetical protein